MRGSVYSSFFVKEDEDYIEFLRDHLLIDDKAAILANDLIYSPFALSKKEFSFKRAFTDESTAKSQIQYIKNLRFAFATIASDIKETPPLRKDIEGRIIAGLSAHYVKELNISEPFKMPFARGSGDTPIGKISLTTKVAFQITQSGPALPSLPSELKGLAL